MMINEKPKWKQSLSDYKYDKTYVCECCRERSQMMSYHFLKVHLSNNINWEPPFVAISDPRDFGWPNLY